MCVFAPVFWLPRELLGYVSYRDTYLCFGFEVFFGLNWFCLVSVSQLAPSFCQPHIFTSFSSYLKIPALVQKKQIGFSSGWFVLGIKFENSYVLGWKSGILLTATEIPALAGMLP